MNRARHLCCALTAAFLMLSLTAPAAPVKPNILVVLTDDMGFSDISAFGGEIATPNIDKLAENGRAFTQFYNTSRCCPTRASLLTGHYPHQAGVGHMLWDTPYPGYSDRLSSGVATIPEVLRTAGYATYMLGKWHLATRTMGRQSMDAWPIQRGFDKFYGTIAGYGSFFDPATLCRDNTYITPQNDPFYKPAGDFYYTDALTDNAIMYLRDHKSASPDKPFFMYLAHTAAHWPIQAPEDAIAPYKGKYDAGYDAIRQARIKRQQELGVPTGIAEPAPTTGDWNALKDKEWEARTMEVYAGMITRMDQGIGRIIDTLRENGHLENTLILYLHDNGACAEEDFRKEDHANDVKNAAPLGPNDLQPRTRPPMQTRDGRPVHTGPNTMAGPADTYLAYGENWANVSNTPLRSYKHHVHEGGISTPLIAHWPASIKPTSGTARFITNPGHLIDIMATCVDLAGAQVPPQQSQQPVPILPGISLTPLLTGQGTFARTEPIFFEHEGNRAVRDGDWKIVSTGYGPWELFNINEDRAEQTDLAAKHPERVERMARQWTEWAKENQVFPVGAFELRETIKEPSTTKTLIALEQGDTLARDEALAIADRPLSITAHIISGPLQGTIVAQGANRSGYTLYARENQIHFGLRRGWYLHEISSGALPPPPLSASVQLTQDGRVTLSINDTQSTSGDFLSPLISTPNEGLSAGIDTESPVGDYPRNWKFRGKLGTVQVEVLPRQLLH